MRNIIMIYYAIEHTGNKSKPGEASKAVLHCWYIISFVYST